MVAIVVQASAVGKQKGKCSYWYPVSLFSGKSKLILL